MISSYWVHFVLYSVVPDKQLKIILFWLRTTGLHSVLYSVVPVSLTADIRMNCRISAYWVALGALLGLGLIYIPFMILDYWVAHCALLGCARKTIVYMLLRSRTTGSHSCFTRLSYKVYIHIYKPLWWIVVHCSLGEIDCGLYCQILFH